MNNIKLRNINLELPLLFKRIDIVHFSEHKNEQEIASKAISCILSGSLLPSPIFHESREGGYKIYNNAQFIIALKSFINNEFPLNENCFLKDFQNLTFSELPYFQQNKISEYKINCIVVSPTENHDTYLSFISIHNSI
jgi:hypothetical protein